MLAIGFLPANTSAANLDCDLAGLQTLPTLDILNFGMVSAIHRSWLGLVYTPMLVLVTVVAEDMVVDGMRID
jgi:hypothetical protein